MSKYKSYEKYIGSNLDWLGKIPAHWKPTYIKGITKTYSEKGKPELELLSVYRDYGVIKKSSRDDNHNKPGMDLSSYKVVHPNTLVLNKMKTWSGSLGVSNYFGIVSPAYITCKIDLEQVETKYLNYLLRCKNYVFEYNRLSYGVRPSQWDMRYQDFKSIPIYLPPKQEQTAIARFLDYKLAKINRFIQKKKQLIKLLNEQKAAIINQAVTKGLDPNTKMKDSGIEWLGEIPEHWEVSKIKWLTPVKRGASPRPIDDPIYFDEDGEFGWVRISDVTASERYLEDTTQKLSELGSSLSVKQFPGDLFLSIAGSVGKPIITKIKCCIHDGFVWFPLLQINKEFIYYIFTAGRCYLGLGKMGTQLNLNTDSVGGITIPLPPTKEIDDIVEFLDLETATINTTISTIEKEIALVEEYKTALIAEAVTGKIDVRGYEVPEITEEETYDDPDSYREEEEISIAAEDVEEYENESDL